MTSRSAGPAGPSGPNRSSKTSRRLQMEIIDQDEKSHAEEKSNYLSSDIIYDILTRVPFQEIGLCRCVSKSWKSMTYESNFKHLHCQRTQTISGFFLQTMIRGHYKSEFISMHFPPSLPKLALDFLPEDVKILASSCRGLLCCTSQDIQHRRRALSSWKIPRYYICKPATAEWRQIPNPKTKYFTERFAMAVLSTKPLQFKLLRLSRPLHTMSYLICEIFDSASWSWKQLDKVSLPDTILTYKSGIFIQRAIHWLTTGDFIFSFNIDCEHWFSISLPKHKTDTNDQTWAMRKLIIYGEKLGLIYYTDSWCELWMLKDIKTETWELKDTLQLQEALCKTCPYFVFQDLYTTETLLLEWASKFIWYNYLTKKATSTEVGGIASHDVLQFESDIVPCNL